MITALALNPSIDMTLDIANFTFGGLNRVESARRDAGGKGLNVALAAQAVGARAECVGYMHRENAALFEDKLRKNQVGYDFIYCDGATRTNIKVRDEAAGVVTELNQSGPAVTDGEIRLMSEKVLQHAAQSDFMVLTGSLPPACPAGYYRELMEEVAHIGCKCVLDADGTRLLDGLRAKPFLIKPNKFELELLTGRKLENLGDIRAAAMKLVDGGVNVVAVSMGGDGAFITDGAQSFYAPRLDVEISSTVGAGDSMVAGMTAGFEMGRDLSCAFAMGVAAATAACRTEGTTVFERADYEAMLKMVRLEAI